MEIIGLELIYLRFFKNNGPAIDAVSVTRRSHPVKEGFAF
jgi:hypothetical protein